MKKVFYLLFISILSSMFFSCKEDDDNGTLNGDPQNVIDPDHVSVDDKYGISAICPKGEWTNNYQDTMELSDGYRDLSSSTVTLGLLLDAVTINDVTSYPSCIYLMKFLYKPTSEEDAIDFINNYRQKAFVNVLTLDYTEVPELTITTVHGYKCYYMQAVMGGDRASYTGKRDLYMFYYNGTVYAAIITVLDDLSSPAAYEKCVSIINTINLK